MQFTLLIDQTKDQLTAHTDPARRQAQRARFDHLGAVEVRPTRVVPIS